MLTLLALRMSLSWSERKIASCKGNGVPLFYSFGYLFESRKETSQLFFVYILE